MTRMKMNGPTPLDMSVQRKRNLTVPYTPRKILTSCIIPIYSNPDSGLKLDLCLAVSHTLIYCDQRKEVLQELLGSTEESVVGIYQQREKEDWQGICCQNESSKEFFMKTGVYDFH